jgi:MSHA pilin protein MshC
MRPSNLPAFTLIELVVVLVLLGIVTAMVIPEMAGGASMQAQGAARVLSGDLEYAQSQAVTSQSNVTVTFNKSANSYTLSNQSGTLVHPITKGAYVVKLGQGPYGSVKIASMTFPSAGTSIVFDSLGTPTPDGSVTLTAGASSYVVTVAPATGRVTVTGH